MSPERPAGPALPAGDLFALVARAAERAPGKAALRFGDEALDYVSLVGRARSLARGLAARGLRRGDRVALMAPNSPDFVVAALGVLAAGAALLPIHTGYRRRELAHLLTDAEPRFLVAGAEERATLAGLEPAERASLAAVVPVEELAAWSAPGGDGTVSSPTEPDELALLLYTSGTTGRSKGAMLAHRNVRATIASLHEAWEWSADDVLLLALPLFHLHGLVVGLLSALAAGATVLLESRFEAAPTLDRLARGEATLFFGVPTLYVRLVDELERGGARDLSRVRLFVSGSAPLPVETFEAFRRATGHAVLERYGMTETGMLAGNPLRGERRAGTVGRPLPGVELRVVGAGGEPVVAGDEGEVEARGENVFAGYWRAPEKSAESFRSGEDGGRWFRTGDLGRIEPATGHLVLLGRASELILSGGFNVYPREIEEVLLGFPGVREAAVVGEEHPEFGQSPAAHLVAEPGLDLEALAAHCRSQLAAFKLPRRFVLRDELPRNAMGKVEKRRL